MGEINNLHFVKWRDSFSQIMKAITEKEHCLNFKDREMLSTLRELNRLRFNLGEKTFCDSLSWHTGLEEELISYWWRMVDNTPVEMVNGRVEPPSWYDLVEVCSWECLIAELT